ncbi:MAG: DUF488 domain-containing protein [bacterium]|nr:DUF488 domain-containing protein [bacterium]MDN5835500.1 DUF488 domain-containing protein [bacterium]
MTTIYTIGHSTRSIDEFIELLNHYKVTQLVDIRSVPGSRHNPQYGQAALEESLKAHNIGYTYLKKLGGWRHGPTGPENAGWHNASFRSYADYMQTPDFTAGIDQLIVLANQDQTAIMCAEAVPWRCHRSLVGDGLLVRDIAVRDIMSPTSAPEHSLTSFAKVSGTDITYPTD